MSPWWWSSVKCCYAGVSNSSLNGGASKVYNSYNLNDLLPLKFGPMDLMSDGKAFPLLLAQQHHKVGHSKCMIPGPGTAAPYSRQSMHSWNVRSERENRACSARTIRIKHAPLESQG
eukprot:1159220-Pelagomonas_calceolata.AAC.7